MNVYTGNTGHIKNHKKFKILFWSRESKKTMFRIFRDFLRKKIRNTEIVVGNPRISSETTRETRQSREGSQKLST